MKSGFSNLTASSERVCSRFEASCRGDDLNDLGQLVFALLAEESIGGACLHQLGLTIEVLASGVFGDHIADTVQDYLSSTGGNVSQPLPPILKVADSSISSYVPDWYLVMRDRAASIAKRSDDGPAVSSEHLVLAMTEVDGFPRSILQQNGVVHEDVRAFLKCEEESVECLKVDLTLKLDPDGNSSSTSGLDEFTEADRVVSISSLTKDALTAAGGENPATMDSRVFALLDANLNRVREGLRVLEDSARFVLCDESTTVLLKGLRHRLVEEEQRLRLRNPLIQRRDVVADVGTDVTTANEKLRLNLRDVLTANCRRMQEALRSLEEFSKLVDSAFSDACKQIRYQAYQAEQLLDELTAQSGSLSAVSRKTDGRNRSERKRLLQRSSLYVLMTEHLCKFPWKQTAEAVLKAGADILQLREKNLPFSELKRRCEWLQGLCFDHDALFIVNDNVELAASCGADGVHLGQTDGSVADARERLNSDQLIGVSTHNLVQLKDAQQTDVDYLGVGPMFSTKTKSFDSYSGPDYAAQAALHASVPWFAIGGINDSNLPELMGRGVQRIAVCGTILGADHPENVVGKLKARPEDIRGGVVKGLGIRPSAGDIIQGLSGFRNAAIDFLFPWSCLFCGDNDESNASFGLDQPWCGNCYQELIQADQQRCQKCAAVVGQYSKTDDGCVHCRDNKIRFESACCVGMYEGALRRAVLASKWSWSSSTIDALSRILIQQYQHTWAELGINRIVAIPQSFRRRLNSHFHTAEIIAGQIARTLQITDSIQALRRVRYVRPQKRVTLSERFSNQHQSIDVRRGVSVKGCRVLIVDDVLTTGATCSEAARTLKTAGAESTDVAVLGRVLSPGP